MPRVCVKGGHERASEQIRRQSERDRGDRAIDKTPNAARPRLIPQAYTHPLVFSLSSPTTHPLDHYPLPSPLSSPTPPPTPFPPPSVLLLPFVSLPLIPYKRPLSGATHPLRESLRTLEAADIRRSLSLSRTSSLLPSFPSRLFISLPLYAFPRRSLLPLCLSLSHGIGVLLHPAVSKEPHNIRPIKQTCVRISRVLVLCGPRRERKKSKEKIGTQERRSRGFGRH